MGKRRSNRSPGSKPKGPAGPQGQPPAATQPGEDLGGGWRIGDTVGPPDWAGKPPKPVNTKQQQQQQPKGRTGPPITTVVEGQPVYAGVRFGRVEANLAQGGGKRGWKRVTKDALSIKGQVTEYLIPNINRKDRFSGEPSYWRVTEDNLVRVIANSRQPGGKQKLALEAGELQTILEQSWKRAPKLYVDRYEEDAISAATGTAPGIRTMGFKEADGTNLYFGNERDREVKGDDGLVGPIDPRAPKPVRLPVPKVDPLPLPDERVFEKPNDSQKNIGVYYFDKGRFLTRGKYNGKTSKTTR